MMKVKVITIDLNDCSLDQAEDTIEAQINEVLMKMHEEGYEVIDIDSFPLTAAHDVSDDYRTRMYHEKGVVAIVKYKERMI